MAGRLIAAALFSVGVFCQDPVSLIPGTDVTLRRGFRMDKIESDITQRASLKPLFEFTSGGDRYVLKETAFEVPKELSITGTTTCTVSGTDTSEIATDSMAFTSQVMKSHSSGFDSVFDIETSYSVTAGASVEAGFLGIGSVSAYAEATASGGMATQISYGANVGSSSQLSNFNERSSTRHVQAATLERVSNFFTVEWIDVPTVDQLSEEFKDAAASLNNAYSPKIFDEFMEDFGTHWYNAATMGNKLETSFFFESTVSTSAVQRTMEQLRTADSTEVYYSKASSDATASDMALDEEFAAEFTRTSVVLHGEADIDSDSAFCASLTYNPIPLQMELRPVWDLMTVAGVAPYVVDKYRAHASSTVVKRLQDSQDIPECSWRGCTFGTCTGAGCTLEVPGTTGAVTVVDSEPSDGTAFGSMEFPVFRSSKLTAIIPDDSSNPDALCYLMEAGAGDPSSFEGRLIETPTTYSTAMGICNDEDRTGYVDYHTVENVSPPCGDLLPTGDCLPLYWLELIESADLDPDQVGYDETSGEWYMDGKPTCIGFGDYNRPCDDTVLVCAGIDDGTFGYGILQTALIAEMIAEGDERHHLCPVSPPSCGDLRTGDCLPPYWLKLIESADLDPDQVGYDETSGEWYVDGKPTCIGFGDYNRLCDDTVLVCAGIDDGTFGYGSLQTALIAEMIAEGDERHHLCPDTIWVNFADQELCPASYQTALRVDSTTMVCREEGERLPAWCPPPGSYATIDATYSIESSDYSVGTMNTAPEAGAYEYRMYGTDGQELGAVRVDIIEDPQLNVALPTNGFYDSSAVFVEYSQGLNLDSCAIVVIVPAGADDAWSVIKEYRTPDEVGAPYSMDMCAHVLLGGGTECDDAAQAAAQVNPAEIPDLWLPAGEYEARLYNTLSEAQTMLRDAESGAASFAENTLVSRLNFTVEESTIIENESGASRASSFGMIAVIALTIAATLSLYQ